MVDNSVDNLCLALWKMGIESVTDKQTRICYNVSKITERKLTHGR